MVRLTSTEVAAQPFAWWSLIVTQTQEQEKKKKTEEEMGRKKKKMAPSGLQASSQNRGTPSCLVSADVVFGCWSDCCCCFWAAPG